MLRHESGTPPRPEIAEARFCLFIIRDEAQSEGQKEEFKIVPHAFPRPTISIAVAASSCRFFCQRQWRTFRVASEVPLVRVKDPNHNRKNQQRCFPVDPR
jgi:hypothetical protein